MNDSSLNSSISLLKIQMPRLYQPSPADDSHSWSTSPSSNIGDQYSYQSLLRGYPTFIDQNSQFGEAHTPYTGYSQEYITPQEHMHELVRHLLQCYSTKIFNTVYYICYRTCHIVVEFTTVPTTSTTQPPRALSTPHSAPRTTRHISLAKALVKEPKNTFEIHYQSRIQCR